MEVDLMAGLRFLDFDIPSGVIKHGWDSPANHGADGAGGELYQLIQSKNSMFHSVLR